MTNDEIQGRLCVLEVFCMTSLGLYLANSRNDPKFDLARGLLDYMRQLVQAKSNDLRSTAQTEALHYSDDLLSQVLENLKKLRGHPG